MAHYVDGYVIPIPKKTKNINSYKKLAKWGRREWMKHGALSYYECIMDDFPSYGMGFKKMAKLKKGETAIFAFIVFKSKAHRNLVNKRVHAEMTGPVPDMPFDMKRFSMAGCKAIVYANK